MLTSAPVVDTRVRIYELWVWKDGAWVRDAWSYSSTVMLMRRAGYRRMGFVTCICWRLEPYGTI